LARLAAGVTSFSDAGLVPETTYFYRIRALNSGGESAASEASARTLAAPREVQSSARFIAVDEQTKGFWPLEYGAEGRWIATEAANFGTNVSAIMNSPTEISWSLSDDPRALVEGEGTNRVAAVWTAAPLTLNVSIPRGTPRKMALYFVDWSRTGAAQEVSIGDVNSGTNLDTRSVQEFGNGKYLVYDVEGNITISISSAQGAAVLSGIFFGGEVPAPISDRPLTFTILGAESNALHVRIAGDAGQRFKIQATADLQSWTDLEQGLLPGAAMEMILRGPEGRGFFRAVNIR
jgi:hypothetical protein